MQLLMVYGTEHTEPEDMPALLAGRKLKTPVLLDPGSAYRTTLASPVFPHAILVDGAGTIRWQGHPIYRKRFADACEAAMDALLVTPAGKGTGGERRKR